MTTPQTVFLLDAYALIFRAYYAFIRAPRRDSQGRDVSAVFGFALSLQDLLDKYNPDYIAVAFDPPGGTFRHREYPEYKAQREATPEGIKLAVPFIKEMLSAYRIPILEVPDFEADDVIGTLAKQASAAGYRVMMVTPDKDYGQLVDDKFASSSLSCRADTKRWAPKRCVRSSTSPLPTRLSTTSVSWATAPTISLAARV